MLGFWLISCMNDGMLKKIIGFDTSWEAWIKIEKTFASKSRAKMIQLKDEL